MPRNRGTEPRSLGHLSPLAHLDLHPVPWGASETRRGGVRSLVSQQNDKHGQSWSREPGPHPTISRMEPERHLWRVCQGPFWKERSKSGPSSPPASLGVKGWEPLPGSPELPRLLAFFPSPPAPSLPPVLGAAVRYLGAHRSSVPTSFTSQELRFLPQGSYACPNSLPSGGENLPLTTALPFCHPSLAEVCFF